MLTARARNPPGTHQRMSRDEYQRQQYAAQWFSAYWRAILEHRAYCLLAPMIHQQTKF